MYNHKSINIDERTLQTLKSNAHKHLHRYILRYKQNMLAGKACFKIANPSPIKMKLDCQSFTDIMCGGGGGYFTRLLRQHINAW